MKSENLEQWNKQKAEELFSLSHKMLDIAKELTECNAKEMRIHVNHTIELAKHSAKNNLKEIERLQNDAAIAAAFRMDEYRMKAKTLLVDAHHELTDHSSKHIQKAMNSLSDWIEHSDNKMPSVNHYLGKVVRDIASSGSIAFEEGRKLITSAMDDADHALNNMASANELATKTHTIPSTEISKSNS
ncbi:hypothetical protein [Polynucleobacter sp. AP-Melu-500A-A1]|jgi:coenzyme F420-reducing hydrogenase alpha subunit|uniref:hypothetical protein n=1 Tax=Polynucleobacter sp. AP-Melu-500A-A1 TaxID=2576929 RepID=UPI001C0DEDA2|nr:hypothetical protein [Polynucleobacter sp. AP-Melu-500A-A1]MBU3630186.1 hypothetical protein [Polynucleobacter sp. AP-Melu-500A-A1]